MAPQTNSAPRQEFEFALASTDEGQITITLVDRINVDDVFMHLIHRELYRLVSGEDDGVEVNDLFKSFLMKERFTAG